MTEEENSEVIPELESVTEKSVSEKENSDDAVTEEEKPEVIPEPEYVTKEPVSEKEDSDGAVTEEEIPEIIPEPEEETISEMPEIKINKGIETEETNHNKFIPAKESETKINKSKSPRSQSGTKSDFRKKDLEKYALAISVSAISSSDPFITSLIEKYTALVNKYGYKTPLGMIDMSKEEYEKLAGIVHNYIITEAPVVSLSAFLCSVFLVKTVADYDYNNNFWGTVSTLLKCDEKSAITYLKKALLCFCSTEKLYFHYYNGGHSYARTVLIHSIINRSTLHSVVDFIKEFYIEEMLEQYDQSAIQAHISLFIDEMVRDLDKTDEKTASGDIDGVYKVSIAFKTACREFPEAVRDGLKCLIYNIDAYYHRTSDVSYSPAVFNKYFKRWKIQDSLIKHINSRKPEQQNQKKTAGISQKNAVQLERLANLQRCTYYIDEEYRLYIYIPQQNIPAEYSQNNIQIRLFDNNISVPEYNKECDVFGMFRFHTGEIHIELKKFYKNLSLKIVTDNDDIIFDSKSQLFRKYLIFDTNLDEYTGRKLPEERFYILNEKNDEFFADANYSSYQLSNYTVHSLDVDDNCDILVGAESVFDSTAFSSDVRINIDSSSLVKMVKAFAYGKEYCVYSSVPEIHCIAENDNAEKYVLDINDYHLNADKLFDVKRDIVLNLKDILNSDKINFVSICLREKGGKKIIYERNIAVLTDFEYSLDKQIYYTDKTAQLLDLYAENAEFEVTDYPCTFSVNSSRKITINCIADKNSFYIDIQLPMIYWEFNEKYNSLSETQYIPASILKQNSSIIIDLPVYDCCLWAVNDNVQRQLTPVNGKLNLSDFIVSASDSTTVGLNSSKTGQIKLFELIHKPSVREITVSCSDDELNVSYIQIGVCPLSISVTDVNGETVLRKSFSSQEDGHVSISENISGLKSGMYSVTVSQIVADEFGFSSETKTIGAFKITKGNAFEVYCQTKNGVISPGYCLFDGNIRKRVNNFYCEDIKSSDNGESGVYTACAFYHNQFGDRVYFEDANPVHIELLEKNDSIITFTVTDGDGDGFIYENARGYLHCDKIGIHDYNSYSLPDHYAVKI